MKKRQNTNRWKRAASVLTAVAVTCAMVLTSVAPAFAATARATTMKLEKTEGTVSLKTQNGTARRITSGMRLYNGNTLETKAKSYAYVSLDSAKAVKLDQSTLATLRQNGKELELLVKSGKLFFNVSQPLTEKESMNVRTSTMVTGIRGTCGIVEHVTSTTSRLYLLEGKVTLGSGENATTIQGGQTATIVVQPKKETSGGGKPGESEKEPVKKITVEKMTEEKVPVFAIQEIVKDPVLQEKIEKTTELKVEKLEVVLEEAKKAEEAGKDPEKESEKEEEKEKEPEQTIPSGGGSVTVDPAPGNPGTSDPKPEDPTPEEPGKDDPETETPVDPGTPEEPEPDTPVDPGMPEEPDTPKDPTRATLTGNVTFAQLNAALAENDEVILEGAVTLDAGEQLLIPSNKTLAVNGSISGEGTISLGEGSTLANNGTITAADMNDAAALSSRVRTLTVRSVKNSGCIQLSGTYASDAAYTYSEDAVLICGDKVSALYDELMMVDSMGAVTSGTSIKCNYLYGSSLNAYVADYLYERSTTGYVSGSFQRDITVNSDVTVRGAGGIHGGVQLYMSGYTICVADGTLTLHGDINVTSSGSKPTMSLQGGHLKMTGVSETNNAIIHNMGSGYAIAVSNGSTITWENPNMLVAAEGGNGRIIEGVTLNENQQPIVPNFMTVATGTLELTADQTMLRCNTQPTETSLYGEVTLSTIKEAFGEYDKVHIREDATLQIPQTESELLIPAGKELVVWGTQSIPTGTAIQVGDGSKQALLCVTEGSELTAGEIHVSAGSRLEDHGTLNCIGLTGGTGSELINNYSLNVNGTMQLSNGAVYENHGEMNGIDLTSEGGAEIINSDVIKLSGAYTSKGTDSYDDGAVGTLISEGESTAMPGDRLLLKDWMVLEDSSASQNCVYSFGFNQNVADHLEERSQLQTVTAYACKNLIVASPVNIRSNSNGLELQLGSYTLQISNGGGLTLGNNVKILSENSRQTVLLSGNGSLELLGGTHGAWISNNGGGYGIARADDATGKVTWSFQYSGEKDLGITANSLEYTIQGCSMNTDGSIAMPEYVITEGIMYYADGSLYQLYPLRATTLSGEVTAETLQKAYLEYGVITLDEGATLKLNDDDAFVIPGGKILNIYGDQSIPTSITIQVGDGRKETQLNFNGTATAGAIRVMAKGQFDSGKVLNCTELTCAADSKASNNGELNVSGTVHLMSGAYYANYQTLNAQALESEGSATIYNTGYIGLQGTYTSAGTDTYEECGLGICVCGTASKAMPEGLLLVREKTTPSTNVSEPENFVYASVLNQRVANYLCGRAKTGNVNASFCRNVQVKSSVELDVKQDQSSTAHYGIYLVLGEYSLEVAANVLTIGSDVSIGSIHPDQTILLSGNAGLELVGGSQFNAQISNTGDGYVIARADDATGTVFWRDTGMGMCSSADKFVPDCSINAADGTVSMPDYVNVQGMVTYKEGTLGLTNIPSTFTAADEVTTAKLQAALRAYNSVTIDQTAKASMSETDTLTIPSGKVLYMNAKMTQEGSAYSGGFLMNKGSRIVIEPGAYMEVSGIVMGNGTIEARTSSTSGGAALTVHTGGQVVAEEINIGSGVTFTNNGIVDIGALNSAGGATINNTELIKIHTAYKYTTEGVTDTYTGTYASVLISNAESTAMPAGSELLNAYITGDSGTKEHVQYYYADYLNTRAGDYINKIIGTYRDDKQQKLWWDFQKNAPVKSATTTTLTDFNADLGTYSIQVSGKLVLDNQTCGTITGSGTTLFDMQGGTLDLTGTTGTLQSGMTSTGEITPADSYVIKGSQSPYQIYWNNPGLTMSAPNGLNKTVDNLYLNSDGSAVVNPDNAYLGILNEYQLVWDAPTNTLAISPVSGS